MDYVRTTNLTIYAGDDRPLQWPLLAADGTTPLDVTGWTARAQVRQHADSEAILHEWSTENTRAQLADGSLSLLVDDSESWTWRVGVYDLHLIDPDGHHVVLDHGTVRVEPGVTRDPA